MQFRPRLTGASGSPWVATPRPSLTPTRTPQPVPQYRQTPLSQRTPSSLPFCCASARPGTAIPAVAAAAATALLLMKSRRVSFTCSISGLLVWIGFVLVIHQRGREHARQLAYFLKDFDCGAFRVRFDGNDHPPIFGHDMQLDPGQKPQLRGNFLCILWQYAEDEAGDIDPRRDFHVHTTPSQFDVSQRNLRQ